MRKYLSVEIHEKARQRRQIFKRQNIEYLVHPYKHGYNTRASQTYASNGYAVVHKRLGITRLACTRRATGSMYNNSS